MTFSSEYIYLHLFNDIWLHNGWLFMRVHKGEQKPNLKLTLQCENLSNINNVIKTASHKDFDQRRGQFLNPSYHLFCSFFPQNTSVQHAELLTN